MAKPVKALTNTQIEKAKLAGKLQSLFDGGGLYLEIKRKSFKTTKKALATAVMAGLLSCSVMATGFAAPVEGISYSGGVLTPGSDGYIKAEDILSRGGGATATSLSAVKAELEGRVHVTEDLLAGDWGGKTVQDAINVTAQTITDLETAETAAISALDLRMDAAESAIDSNINVIIPNIYKTIADLEDTTYTAGTNVGINTDNQISAADSKITGITKEHDGASGSVSYTIQYTTDTVKDGAVQTEEKSYVITDTNTHASVSDDGNGYVSVTKTSEATATAGPAYQVSMSDDAKTAIGNANTYLNSNGFSAGGGKVTVTKDGFAVQGGPSMTADGIDAGGQAISNVKDGKVEKGSKEAVTGGQLYDIQQQNSSQDDALKKLAHRDAQLERKIYRAGAHAAAIAALHPLDYDEDHKFTAAAGIGQYHGSSAMAVGAFYRPTENLMFSVGASLNENDSMVNAGMAYRFGTGSGSKTSPNNLHELKRQVSDLSEENRQLSAQLNSSEIKLAEESQKRASADAKILTLEEKIRRIEKMLKLK
ncbi:MAG: YadA-like family protein [Bacteroidales bacterium]|nr:YadA-like family protein [Bacteroidales bacterium]